MNLDCLCAGILVADHLCEPIERLPAAGELVLSRSLPLEIGGCASNVAIDLARLGVGVGVAGCVGNDAMGRFIRDTLVDRGVDTRGIRSQDELGTSGTLIINVEGEDRRFIHAIGANALFTADDIARQPYCQARVLYIGGYLLMPQLEPQGLRDVFREARRAGVITVLDVVLPEAAGAMERLAPVLSETDVFLPNEDEAAAITGLSDPLQQAQAFLDAGAATVVITAGSQGTWLVSQQERLRAGVYPVQFVGGTGAGDAFDAGYIAALLQGSDARECLRWGSALGASCVRSVGATQSVFTRDEAEDFMRRHSLEIEAV